MRRFLGLLLEHLSQFLGLSHTKPAPASPSQQETAILNTIQLALYKKAAVHVIYGNKSFTGDITKFDPVRQQLILKNFQKNITAILSLKEIQRIRLVPSSIQETQKQARTLH